MSESYQRTRLEITKAIMTLEKFQYRTSHPIVTEILVAQIKELTHRIDHLLALEMEESAYW